MICILDGELYYTGGNDAVRKRVVLNVKEIGEILKLHHSDAMGGHSGVNATLFKVSNYYHWNGMKEDIQEYVSFISKQSSVLMFSFCHFFNCL